MSARIKSAMILAAMASLGAQASAQGWVWKLDGLFDAQSDMPAQIQDIELAPNGDLMLVGNSYGPGYKQRGLFMRLNDEAEVLNAHEVIAPRRVHLSVRDSTLGRSSELVACGSTLFQDDRLPWIGAHDSETGALLWQATPSSERGWLSSIAPTAGGFAAVGAAYDPCSNETSGLVTRLDDAGALLWQKRIHMGAGDLQFSDLVALPNGQLCIAGSTQQRLVLVVLAENGELQSANGYGTPHRMNSPTIARAGDGGLFVGGAVFPVGESDGTPWIARLDSTGGIIWEHLYPTLRSLSTELIATADGGCALIGMYQQNWSDARAALLRLDANGIALWNQRFELTHPEAYATHADAVERPDGGFYVAVHSRLGASEHDDQVLSVSPDGDANGPCFEFSGPVQASTLPSLSGVMRSPLDVDVLEVATPTFHTPVHMEWVAPDAQLLCHE